jgi:hypothetical protein
MSINNLILIHNNVEEPELLKSSFKNSHIILYNKQSVDEILSEINSLNITNLALVFHPTNKIELPFFKETNLSIYQIFRQGLVDLINKINNGGLKVDLLACYLSHPIFIEKVKLAESDLNIDIRHSLDNTGNQTNWTLESDNVDIKDYYFNENINNWNYTLFPEFFSTNLGNKGLFYKMIYDNSNNPTGQIQRNHLIKDISGNIVTPLYDNSGINIKYTSSNVISWGSYIDSNNQINNEIISVCSTWGAMAGLKSDGTVITWGESSAGGDSSSVSSLLNNIIAVYSTSGAFAALKSDGTVITWGDPLFGGDSASVSSQLNNIKIIYSTSYAFAALKHNGSVVVWGNSNFGGSPVYYINWQSYSVQSLLTNIVTIYSTWSAFAALKSDGSVVTWGANGGNSSGVQSNLNNVVAIYSTGSAFAALKNNKTVVTWGDSGGNSSSVQSQLNNVENIYSTNRAFAALKIDGTVVTWGDSEYGGNSSLVQGNLSNIVTIYSNGLAFSALKIDGTLITWGNSENGGDSSLVMSELNNIVRVQSTYGAFAGLKSDGSVVVWGNSEYGGDIAELETLANIKNLYSNYYAFVAVNEDDRAVAWGDSLYGGDSAVVESELKNILMIYSTNVAFGSLSELDSYVLENMVIIPDTNSVVITYDRYKVFVPIEVELLGDLSGLTINFLPNKSNFDEGFILTGLLVQTMYDGEFRLKNGESMTELTIVNFTTLSPPEIQNVSFNVGETTITVTYDEYNIFEPNVIDEILLLGDLVGATIEFLPLKSDYKEGFVITGLLSNNVYSGGFKLSSNNLETPSVSLSVKTINSDISDWANVDNLINELINLEEELTTERRKLIMNKREIQTILYELSLNSENESYPTVQKWNEIAVLENKINININKIINNINLINEKKIVLRDLIRVIRNNNIQYVPVDYRIKFYYDKFISNVIY